MPHCRLTGKDLSNGITVHESRENRSLVPILLCSILFFHRHEGEGMLLEIPSGVPPVCAGDKDLDKRLWGVVTPLLHTHLCSGPRQEHVQALLPIPAKGTRLLTGVLGDGPLIPP